MVLNCLQNQNYSANNLFTARVNLDFFLEAVFLCKIPFETALSHNWYAFDKATFKFSSSLFPRDMVQYPCKQEIPPFLLDLLSLSLFSFQNTFADGAVCVTSGSQNRKQPIRKD